MNQALSKTNNYTYSQTCIKRPPTGPNKSGRLIKRSPNTKLQNMQMPINPHTPHLHSVFFTIIIQLIIL